MLIDQVVDTVPRRPADFGSAAIAASPAPRSKAMRTGLTAALLADAEDDSTLSSLYRLPSDALPTGRRASASS